MTQLLFGLCLGQQGEQGGFPELFRPQFPPLKTGSKNIPVESKPPGADCRTQLLL